MRLFGLKSKWFLTNNSSSFSDILLVPKVSILIDVGSAEPTSISIDTFGTSKMSEKELELLVRNHFDLRPKSLINALDLKRPIYRDTAAYGHFGRDGDNFTWEKTDLANILRDN